MSEKIEVDGLIIGGGVIGLAVASTLSKNQTVVLTEKYSKFGQETSSRNSEVVHSGIYYPLNSKKTEWCIRGRNLLYHFCDTYKVPYKKTHKVVVATQDDEIAYLEKLSNHCKAVDVPYERMSAKNIQDREPKIVVREGVYLPETGIVNSHILMEAHEKLFLEQGGFLAYEHTFKNAEKVNGRWNIQVQTPDGNILEVSAQYIVNCAGLGAAEISNNVLNTKKYEHRYCRGRYFSLSPKYNNQFSHLIYPVPPKDGLGIHITVDLDGYARLGPDVDWCKESDYATVAKHYDCDWDALVPSFTKSVQRYLPTLEEKDIAAGMIGIRPKLFIDGTAKPDFLVENHEGFIHCLGIESPGLTSHLAIAECVYSLVSSSN